MTMLTQSQIAYLATQRLGRLATVDSAGAPQNNPVGIHYNVDTGTIDILGRDMTNSRKWRNVQGHPDVAFVVDDVASVDPWVVRGVEVRGRAEALPERGGTIRIHPRRVISWNLDAEVA